MRPPRTHEILAVLVVILHCRTVHAQNFQQIQINAPDAASGDYYGAAMAAVGSTVVVVGAVYKESVYLLSVTSPSQYTNGAKLTASNGVSGDQFGFSVAAAGSLVVVGANNKAIGSSSAQGAAYVFSCSSFSSCAQGSQLVAVDGSASDQFGEAVAVNGSIVIVGASGKSTNTGAAYVFLCAAYNSCAQKLKLTSGGSTNAYFGYSIAMSTSSPLVAIGAYSQTAGSNTNQGIVYVYSYTSASSFSSATQISASDATGYDSFGAAVAFDGTKLLVGAKTKYYGSISGQGGAFLFSCPSASTCTQTAELKAPDPVANDYLGVAVALSGSLLVVGAYNKAVGSNTAQGTAYVFTCPGGQPPCTLTSELVAISGDANDNFGFRTAVIGSYVVVSARKHDHIYSNQGAIYVSTCSAGGSCCVYNYAGTSCSVCSAAYTGPGCATSLCTSTQFLNGSSCVNCHSPCLSCSGSATACTACDASGSYPYLQDSTCVSACSGGTPYLYTDSGNVTTCVANCPGNVPYVQNGVCSAACSGSTPNIFNGTLCVATCMSPYPFSKNNICVSACSSPDAYSLGSVCVAGCSPVQYSDASNACHDCVAPCLSCSSATACNGCQPGATPYLEGTTCVASCSGSTPVLSNGRCVPLCSGGTPYIQNGTCASACSGATPIYQGYLCVSSCYNSSQYVDGTQHCQSCSSSCLTCFGSASNCTTCLAGQYLQQGQCVSECSGVTPYAQGTVCVSTCVTPAPYAQQGVCSPSCTGGTPFYQGSVCVASCNDTQYADANSVCQSCDASCTACYGSATACIACTGQTFLYDGVCVTGCPSGYYSDAAAHRCVACADPLCLHCSSASANACTMCGNGTYNFQGACVNSCPSASYNSGGATCAACSASCTTCTGGQATDCLSCSNGLFLSGTTCIPGSLCPTKTFASQQLSLCASCDASCGSCSSTATQCTSCANDLLYLYNSQCVLECPATTQVQNIRGINTCQPKIATTIYYYAPALYEDTAILSLQVQIFDQSGPSSILLDHLPLSRCPASPLFYVPVPNTDTQSASLGISIIAFFSLTSYQIDSANCTSTTPLYYTGLSANASANLISSPSGCGGVLIPTDQLQLQLNNNSVTCFPTTCVAYTDSSTFTNWPNASVSSVVVNGSCVDGYGGSPTQVCTTTGWSARQGQCLQCPTNCAVCAIGSQSNLNCQNCTSGYVLSNGECSAVQSLSILYLVAATGGAAVVTVIAYFIRYRRHWRHPQLRTTFLFGGFLYIPLLFVGVFDLISDAFFIMTVHEATEYPIYFIVALIFTVVPYVVNLLTSLFVGWYGFDSVSAISTRVASRWSFGVALFTFGTGDLAQALGVAQLLAELDDDSQNAEGLEDDNARLKTEKASSTTIAYQHAFGQNASVGAVALFLSQLLLKDAPHLAILISFENLQAQTNLIVVLSLAATCITAAVGVLSFLFFTLRPLVTAKPPQSHQTSKMQLEDLDSKSADI